MPVRASACGRRDREEGAPGAESASERCWGYEQPCRTAACTARPHTARTARPHAAPLRCLAAQPNAPLSGASASLPSVAHVPSAAAATGHCCLLRAEVHGGYVRTSATHCVVLHPPQRATARLSPEQAPGQRQGAGRARARGRRATRRTGSASSCSARSRPAARSGRRCASARPTARRRSPRWPGCAPTSWSGCAGPALQACAELPRVAAVEGAVLHRAGLLYWV